MRTVCLITGTRAEYGLLSGLIQRIEESEELQLRLLVTGSHLSEVHGSTVNEIIRDGHSVSAEVPILGTGDERIDVAHSMARAMSGIADALQHLSPDIVVVLGDRYEILAAAAAALVLGIPIAHLHGGETTEGAIDESMRHAISKMSNLHFVAAEPYRRRLIQMGEDPNRVFLVGGLGVDVITETSLMSRQELEESLGFSLWPTTYLVTFHPETLGDDPPERQIEPLLDALSDSDDACILFTMPNADPRASVLRRMIRRFVSTHRNAYGVDSLGRVRYLSCLKEVSAVVGNSSSGLAEAPTFKVPTVNIGSRQDGRLRATSVIDVPNDAEAIRRALRRATSPEFRALLASAENPYGQGGASASIVEVLSDIPLGGLTRKHFFDVSPSTG